MVAILSIVAFVLQLSLILFWGRRYLINKKRRRLFKEIGDFHTDNYEELIEKVIANTGSHEDAIEYLNMFEDISEKYFSGCSLQELQQEFNKLKVSYAEHLPKIKSELRNSNIDSLLELE